MIGQPEPVINSRDDAENSDEVKREFINISISFRWLSDVTLRSSLVAACCWLIVDWIGLADDK